MCCTLSCVLHCAVVYTVLCAPFCTMLSSVSRAALSSAILCVFCVDDVLRNAALSAQRCAVQLRCAALHRVVLRAELRAVCAFALDVPLPCAPRCTLHCALNCVSFALVLRCAARRCTGCHVLHAACCMLPCSHLAAQHSTAKHSVGCFVLHCAVLRCIVLRCAHVSERASMCTHTCLHAAQAWRKKRWRASLLTSDEASLKVFRSPASVHGRERGHM